MKIPAGLTDFKEQNQQMPRQRFYLRVPNAKNPYQQLYTAN